MRGQHLKISRHKERPSTGWEPEFVVQHSMRYCGCLQQCSAHFPLSEPAERAALITHKAEFCWLSQWKNMGKRRKRMCYWEQQLKGPNYVKKNKRCWEGAIKIWQYQEILHMKDGEEQLQWKEGNERMGRLWDLGLEKVSAVAMEIKYIK